MEQQPFGKQGPRNKQRRALGSGCGAVTDQKTMNNAASHEGGMVTAAVREGCMEAGQSRSSLRCCTCGGLLLTKHGAPRLIDDV